MSLFRQAPDVSRGALATPCGLLFNELACSPHTTVDAVVNLLTLALDLDIGKVRALFACELGHLLKRGFKWGRAPTEC